MRSKLFVQLEVLPCFEQMNVKIGKQRKACRLLFLFYNFLAHDQVDLVRLVFLSTFFLFLRVAINMIIDTTQRNNYPVGPAIELITEFIDGFLYQIRPDQNIIFESKL